MYSFDDANIELFFYIDKQNQKKVYKKYTNELYTLFVISVIIIFAPVKQQTFSSMKLRIKELCAQKHTTQKEVAKILDVSEMTLSRASNGYASLSMLEKIASALGVEIWELFAETTDKPYFCALIKCGNNNYHANTLNELKTIIEQIENINP